MASRVIEVEWATIGRDLVCRPAGELRADAEARLVVEGREVRLSVWRHDAVDPVLEVSRAALWDTEVPALVQAARRRAEQEVRQLCPK
jgi:hypothetical protein